jgi:hypothetical protein
LALREAFLAAMAVKRPSFALANLCDRHTAPKYTPGKTKAPAMPGLSWFGERMAQADFFFGGAAFFTAAGLVTVALAPATAGCAECARVLP